MNIKETIKTLREDSVNGFATVNRTNMQLLEAMRNECSDWFQSLSPFTIGLLNEFIINISWINDIYITHTVTHTNQVSARIMFKRVFKLVFRTFNSGKNEYTLNPEILVIANRPIVQLFIVHAKAIQMNSLKKDHILTLLNCYCSEMNNVIFQSPKLGRDVVVFSHMFPSELNQCIDDTLNGDKVFKINGFLSASLFNNLATQRLMKKDVSCCYNTIVLTAGLPMCVLYPPNSLQLNNRLNKLQTLNSKKYYENIFLPQGVMLQYFCSDRGRLTNGNGKGKDIDVSYIRVSYPSPLIKIDTMSKDSYIQINVSNLESTFMTSHRQPHPPHQGTTANTSAVTNHIVEQVIKHHHMTTTDIATVRKVVSSFSKDCSRFKQPLLPSDIVDAEVTSVLNEQYGFGCSMKAIFCIVQDLLYTLEHTFRGQDKSSDPGIWLQGSDMKKLFKLPKKISSGAQGEVFCAKLLSSDATIIIKRPIAEQNGAVADHMRDSIHTEYVIGLQMNTLRNKIPVFMYTLGLYNCPSTDNMLCAQHTDIKTFRKPHLITEYVLGTTLTNMIQSKKFTYQELLVIYMQVLIGLEIAQRDCEFTHYDLHTDNVMIRITEPYTYSVNIDNNTFTFENIKYIPVIIDYGLTSVRISNDSIVGVSEVSYKRYNILKTLCSGYDMTKLWVSIMKAYDTYDPDLAPKIYEIGRHFIIPLLPYPSHRDADQAIYDKITGSKLSTVTPLQFFNMLYRMNIEEVKGQVVIETRKTTYQLQPETVDDQLYFLIKENKQKSLSRLELINKCVSFGSSYALAKYILYIFSENVLDTEQSAIGEKVRNQMTENRRTLINNDKQMLMKIFNIVLPEEQYLLSLCERIRSFHSMLPNGDDKLDVVTEWVDNIQPQLKQLKPYFNMYYMIHELNIELYYEEWIQKFKQSVYYNIMSNDNLTIMLSQVDRICTSLIARELLNK